MPAISDFSDPAQVAAATPTILGYLPEPGRLVLHANNAGTLTFTASIEVLDPADDPYQGNVNLIVDAAIQSGANQMLAVLYVEETGGHLPVDAVTVPFTAAGLTVSDVLLVNPRQQVRSAVDGTAWLPVPVLPGSPTKTRAELVPAPAAPLGGDAIASEIQRINDLDPQARVDLVAAAISSSPDVTVTVAAAVSFVAGRDWAVRCLADLISHGNRDDVLRCGDAFLAAAQAAPQPWASNLAAVAAAAYYTAGQANVAMHTALDLAGAGASASFADLMTRMLMSGMDPRTWVDGVLSIPAADIANSRDILDRLSGEPA